MTPIPPSLDHAQALIKPRRGDTPHPTIIPVAPPIQCHGHETSLEPLLLPSPRQSPRNSLIPSGAEILKDDDTTGILTPSTAKSAIPETLSEARNIFQRAMIDDENWKTILRALKVSGLPNAKLVSKRDAIAVQMVQRAFAINNVLKITGNAGPNLEPLSSAAAVLCKLPQTTLKISKYQGFEEKYIGVEETSRFLKLERF